MAGAHGGHWRRALDLLEAMPAQYGLTPDVASYGGAMQAIGAAAGAAGALDAGFELLERALAALPAAEAAQTRTPRSTCGGRRERVRSGGA